MSTPNLNPYVNFEKYCLDNNIEKTYVNFKNFLIDRYRMNKYEINLYYKVIMNHVNLIDAPVNKPVVTDSRFIPDDI